MSVLIETTLGDLVVDLYVKERPRTCLNFLKLCKLKFYNFCLFHTIEQNFIAQTGDPTETGRGGDSIFRMMYGDQATFFEKETIPLLKHTKTGTVSMVNSGQDLHASQVLNQLLQNCAPQFFFTLAENLDYLDETHTVFGQVAEGFDTLTALNEALCSKDNRPYKDIRIMHTIILDDPFDDPKGLQFPSRSPSPSERLLKSSRIAVDEPTDETAGLSDDAMTEQIEAKEARARAHILEMVGDLHHAEERPPDNVLFVCKLNPVTTEEDLEIIFSRFGTILSCEVIRDGKTNNSLQYAFIEFETCESAYFKMDNVLIDDRRIHVDFSQSVAKNFQWKKQVNLHQTDKGEKEKSKSKPKEDHNKKKEVKKHEAPKRHRSSSDHRHSANMPSSKSRHKSDHRESHCHKTSHHSSSSKRRSRSRERRR